MPGPRKKKYASNNVVGSETSKLSFFERLMCLEVIFRLPNSIRRRSVLSAIIFKCPILLFIVGDMTRHENGERGKVGGKRGRNKE